MRPGNHQEVRRRCRSVLIVGATISALALALWYARFHGARHPQTIAEAREAFSSADRLSKIAQQLQDGAAARFEGTSMVATAVQESAAFLNQAAQDRRSDAYLLLLASKVDAAIESNNEFLASFASMPAAQRAHEILRGAEIDSIIRTVPDPAGEAPTYQIYIAGENRERIPPETLERVVQLSETKTGGTSR